MRHLCWLAKNAVLRALYRAAVLLGLRWRRAWSAYAGEALGEYYRSRGVTDASGPVFEFLERWRNKFPAEPEPILRAAEAAYQRGDGEAFARIEAYDRALRAKRARMEFKSGFEIVPHPTFYGALGNAWALYMLLAAEKAGLRDRTDWVFPLDGKARITNPALLDYFRGHIRIAEDAAERRELRRLEAEAAWKIGFVFPARERSFFLEHGQALTHALGGGEPLFKLSEAHRIRGEAALRQLGLPAGAWFAGLHVRESEDSQDIRSADPRTYVLAINEVTRRGGWVIRLGDAKMTPLPPMERFVDYPFTRHKSDWMDVFLCAACRFQIGGPSGVRTLSQMFGVPVLLPDGLPYINCAYTLSNRDMFLPKLLKRGDGSLVPIAEALSPRLAMLTQSANYERLGLQRLSNSPEELKEAVSDMLDFVSGAYRPEEEAVVLQDKFEAASSAASRVYPGCGRDIRALARIPRSFLLRHKELFA